MPGFERMSDEAAALLAIYIERRMAEEYTWHPDEIEEARDRIAHDVLITWRKLKGTAYNGE